MTAYPDAVTAENYKFWDHLFRFIISTKSWKVKKVEKLKQDKRLIFVISSCGFLFFEKNGRQKEGPVSSTSACMYVRNLSPR